MKLTAAKIITDMKYETYDNFLRLNSRVKDLGESVYDANRILSLVPSALLSAKNKIERLEIKEQEFFAALNVGDVELAKRVYTEFTKTFPANKYRKTSLYKGMILELENNFEEAEKIYTSLDEESDYYQQFRKRLIAIKLAKGDRKASIEMLNDYLRASANDNEAWSQLAKLYMYESMLLSALHCYEELSLLNPFSHVVAARCGDLVSIVGRHDIALKYYCKSLSYFPDHLHALYGMLISANSLLADPTLSNAQAYHDDTIYFNEEKTRKLLNIAISRIRSIYNSKYRNPSSTMVTFVANKWLDQV